MKQPLATVRRMLPDRNKANSSDNAVPERAAVDGSGAIVAAQGYAASMFGGMALLKMFWLKQLPRPLPS